MNLFHQKKCTVKKTQKLLNAYIFILFGFKNKTKKWNLILTITSLSLHFLPTFDEGSG
jgi:hypothetical protein